MNRNNKPARIIKGTALQPTLKDASGVWTLDEAMQAHRANAWPQPDLFQPVANSLRNSLGKTGYISREFPGRSGSQRKFTFSWWLKKNSNATSSQQHLFYSYDGSRLFQIFFERGAGATNPDCICVYGGGADLRFIPVLRDTSAWYNIVIAVDIDQPTSANTVKCWINGVQITTVGTQGGSPGTPSYPSSTTNWPINQAGVYQRIGGNASGGTFDGQFAEINFVDGAQLQPTLFGKFDTNNTWVPIPYTGSYGTNGFYLPFNNATTSQTLGYDASLNSTTTYDADQDPYRGSVSLHLTGNGPAGGQNNTFVDSSTNNLAITRNGSTTQGSFSPFPLNTNTPYNPAIHGGSAYFGTTTSDNVYAASNSALTIGLNNFTLEFWANWTAWTGEQRMILMGQSGSSAIEISRGAGADTLLVYTNTGLKIGYSWSPAIGAWHHIAIVRTGVGSGQLVLYINGVNVATGTSADSISTNNFFVGGLNWATGYNMRGYISNVRLINGSAIYNNNFVPPSGPLGTQTLNLLNYSESLWDTNNSLNATSSALTLQAPAIDGSMTGVKLIETTATGARYVLQNANVTSGTTYVHSVYAKAGERKFLQMAASTGFTNGNDFWVNYDLVGGTYSIQGANALSGTASITNMGGGWFRCAISSVGTSNTTTGRYTMSIAYSLTDTRLQAGAGDGLSGLYLSWPQLEIGTTPTTYVPTPSNYQVAPSLLLNFANAAVVDSAGGDNIITGSGATITSSNKYGSGALTFNGTSDYVATSSATSYTFGSANFTAEYWVYFNSVASTQAVAAAYNSGGSNTSSPIGWTIRSNGVLGWEGYVGTIDFIGNALTPTATVTANTWHHVATVRNNGEIIAFLNGRIVGRVSVGNAAMATPAGGVHIGRAGQYNGQYFNGSVDDFRITKGVARYQSNFTPPARALPEVGGKSFTTVNVNAGVVQRFTTTGTTSWTAPSDVTSVEVLVVAGGGGGSNYNSAGGGGAGGLIYNNSYPVTPNQTYTVTVGAGGVGGGVLGNPASDALAAATSGGNSVFGALVAIGGGNGGQGNVQGSRTGDVSPSAGGSGGGARASSSPANVGGAGTAGQGFAGGNSGNYDTNYPGGGGGGAGGVGGAGVSSTTAGNGGVGLQFGISGTSTYYAGGGGGSTQNTGTNSTGGLGGGGAGGGGTSGTFINGVAGTANTGGGGGAGGFNGATGVGGAGGSGIVILRYTTTAVGNSSDATTDNLVDSPTLYGHDTGTGGEVVGNYATWNPLIGANYNNVGVIGSSIVVLSNGNLTAFNPANSGFAPRMQCHSNIGMTTGKWYAEFTGLSGRGAGISLGDYLPAGGTGSGVSNSLILQPSSGAVNPATGASATVTGTAVAITTTDVVGVAFDVDNRTCYYYRNGVLTQTATNITTTLGTPYFSSGVWYFTSQPESSGSPSTVSANFGQRAWAYTPPAGFNALTTKNFARPTVGSAAANPNQYFDTVTYTGTGSYPLTVSGFNFQPDLIWVKDRNSSGYHRLFDRVRGATSSPSIYSNATSVEGADNVSFTSNGFTYSSEPYGGGMNLIGNSHVVWGWRAGGAPVSNTAGTITSSVSANTTSGFSVVTWTGVTGGTGTVGHGLSTAPKLIITKQRNQTGDWYTYTTVIDGSMDYLLLNTAAAKGNSGLAIPTSTVFSNDGWTGTSNMVAYCWAEVEGFSKIGTYTGNGSTDGTFVYTGFRPAFILTKDITTGSFWWEIVDSARAPFNPSDKTLYANVADSEYTGSGYNKDLLSNGFKIRGTNGGHNTSGSTYIYMAFAAKPFGNVNGTAR